MGKWWWYLSCGPKKVKCVQRRLPLGSLGVCECTSLFPCPCSYPTPGGGALSPGILQNVGNKHIPSWGPYSSVL